MFDSADIYTQTSGLIPLWRVIGADYTHRAQPPPSAQIKVWKKLLHPPTK